MSDLLTLDFLCDGESAAAADEMWSKLHRESQRTDGLDVDEEFGSDWLLSTFSWRRLRCELQPFDGDDGPERWTVPDLPHVEVRYDSKPFTEAFIDDRPLAPVADELLELVTAVYQAPDQPPRFVYGVTGLHLELLAGNEVPLPVTAESLADDRIEYSTWLMLFPPAMVDTYGRETLLSAPTWHVDEFGDGSVLVVSTPNPTYPGETGAIDDHLGIEPPAELDGCTY